MYAVHDGYFSVLEKIKHRQERSGQQVLVQGKLTYGLLNFVSYYAISVNLFLRIASMRMRVHSYALRSTSRTAVAL